MGTQGPELMPAPISIFALILLTDLFGFTASMVAFLFVIVVVLVFIYIYDNLRRGKKPVT